MIEEYRMEDGRLSKKVRTYMLLSKSSKNFSDPVKIIFINTAETCHSTIFL